MTATLWLPLQFFYVIFIDVLFLFTIFHFMCTIAVYLIMSIKHSH